MQNFINKNLSNMYRKSYDEKLWEFMEQGMRITGCTMYEPA